MPELETLAHVLGKGHHLPEIDGLRMAAFGISFSFRPGAVSKVLARAPTHVAYPKHTKPFSLTRRRGPPRVVPWSS